MSNVILAGELYLAALIIFVLLAIIAGFLINREEAYQGSRRKPHVRVSIRARIMARLLHLYQNLPSRTKREVHILQETDVLSIPAFHRTYARSIPESDTEATIHVITDRSN